MWRKVLREYFAFPKKERQGLLVLFIIWFAIIIYKWFSTYNHHYDDWKIQIKTDSFIVASEKKIFDKNLIKESNTELNFNKFSKSIIESNFNELKHLGISSRTSAIIMKFINSGAKLESRESIEKIYGIDDNEKKILLENFLFTELENKLEIKKSFNLEIIDINTCDSASLESLPRIGPALSTRIIKYRNRLGGFIDKKQLLEVYGLDSTVLKLIESKIDVDIRSIKKIKINQVQYDDLSKFPYLSFKLARVIINYREQHGSFNSKEDLLKIHLMNHKIIDKLEPYIDYTNEH